MFENSGITIGSCYDLMRVPLEILKSFEDEDLTEEDDNLPNKQHKSIPKSKGLSNLNVYFNVKIEEESGLASVYKENEEEEEKFEKFFEKEENSKEVIENYYFLPKSTHSYTVCIDLDETLIHADFKLEFDDPDYIFEGKIEDKSGVLPIYIRPGLSKFLERVSSKFELILFTSSTKEYADIMLSLVDPERKYFKSRLYRDNCVENKGFLLKDLRVIGNRQLEKIILIDNNLINMSPQLRNGYLISSFFNDKNDNELKKVADLLCENSSNAEKILNKFTFDIN